MFIPYAILVPLGRSPTWRLHTKLYNSRWNCLPNNAAMKNFTELNLGAVFCLSIIYHILDSWLNLLNGYDFIFDANHQLLLQSRVSENLVNPRSFISVANDLKTLFYCWFNLHDTLFTKWSVMNRRNKVTQIKVYTALVSIFCPPSDYWWQIS